MVVKLVGDLARVERDGDGLLCGGGASLAVVVKRAEGFSLAGVEFFCAIPGTVGGGGADERRGLRRRDQGRAGEALLVSVRRRPACDPDGLEMTYRRLERRPG